MPDCIPKPDRRSIPDRRGRSEGPTAPAASAAPPAPAAPSEREVRLSRTFDLAPVSLTHVTPDGRFIELNQRAVDLFGYSREELLELNFADLTHPDDLAADRAGRARLLAGEIPQHRMEKRLIRKDGTVVWGVLTISLVRTATGAPDYFIAATEDITARKRAEEALAASERRLGHIAATVPGMVYQGLTRPDGSLAFPYVGAGARELLGIAPEDLQRDPALFLAAIYPEDRPSWEAAVAHSSATHELWRWEGRVVRPTGEERWVEGAARGEWLPDGSVLWTGICMDVTERRRAEARLEESEERYRSLFELHPDVVVAVDPQGRFTSVNPASEAVVGYRPEELLGQPFAPMIVPEDLDRAVAHFRATMAGEAQPPHELAIRHKGGRRVEVSATTVPIVVHGRVVGVYGLVRDLTAQHALEAQLRQAQKLEAVGQLAGGVAHEFNNLLMAILASAELLLEETAGQPGREDAEIIREAATRAATLTRQLLDFSRQHPVHLRPIDVNTVVRDTGRLLRRILGEGITLALELEPALGEVLADPSQLEQAVVNLVVNARDAMPRGGRLTLRTRHVVVDEAEARGHRGLRPGGDAGMYMAIAVEDTGVGIAPELQHRLFEPFFSTKPVGQGSGLGLATVYGIVEQWGGWIDIQSAPGAGTTVTLYLPEHAGVPHHHAPPALQPSRTETILVVDDEARVRHALRRLLTRQGYTVLEAAHGAEALRVLEESTTPVDLVLTDLVMPVLDGRGLIAALRRRPGAPRIVAMSGYDRAAALRGQPLPADVGFLQKPVTSAELFRRVREALEADRSPAAEPPETHGR
jgi:two-component system, cell cycle sensor histidine kinase and response regulator CckA